MKGIVFDIKRFAIHDGPGIRTTVFLKGCPLRCWWCHNPESQELKSESDIKKVMLEGKTFDRRENIGKQMTVEEVMEIIDKDAVFFDESGGGVTISGGEPLMQPGFLKQLLVSCKEKGYHTTVDTCGHAAQQKFASILPFTDLFLYDLKIMDAKAHQNYTGQNNRLIRSNLDFLLAQDQKVIIRIPVVPDINDGEKEIEAMLDFLEQRNQLSEIHLLPYHGFARNKYKRFKKENKLSEINSMEKEDLSKLRKKFENEGFVVKLGG